MFPASGKSSAQLGFLIFSQKINMFNVCKRTAPFSVLLDSGSYYLRFYGIVIRFLEIDLKATNPKKTILPASQSLTALILSFTRDRWVCFFVGVLSKVNVNLFFLSSIVPAVYLCSFSKGSSWTFSFTHPLALPWQHPFSASFQLVRLLTDAHNHSKTLDGMSARKFMTYPFILSTNVVWS